MDEGRTLGIKILKAVTHFVQDIVLIMQELITKKSVWFLLDKFGQVTMEPQTDVVPVITIVKSHEAINTEMIQLAQNMTLSCNGIILSAKVVFVELLCGAFLFVHGGIL